MIHWVQVTTLGFTLEHKLTFLNQSVAFPPMHAFGSLSFLLLGFDRDIMYLVSSYNCTCNLSMLLRLLVSYSFKPVFFCSWKRL